MQQMDKHMKEQVLTIQSKDGEIIDQRRHIQTLMDELERLKNEAQLGGKAQSDLERLLQETQKKLSDSYQVNEQLETTINQNEQKYQGEYKRLNTEIERLNNILKATNGNLQEQVQKLND